MARIAALQMKVACGDVAANLARIATAAAEAKAAGADLLVLPELALTGYGADAALAGMAEPVDGPQVTRLRAISRETGVAIIAGFAERDGETVYNSAVYVDGDGPATVYRKSHLYGDYERGHFVPGQPAAIVFSHRGLSCGMLICYDVEFPENVRRLAEAGVDAVLVPTALPAGWSGSVIADVMIATRAFENQVLVAYVNHCGADPLFTFAGQSRVAAPDGTILAKGPASGESLMVFDYDPADYAVSRAENAYLRDLVRAPA
ncbi:Predicted amidohydrolase [Rhizobium sp. RU20A]|uniref:carbon-nitrogen hydrolase family protein n=1 Tax=Rhizobium sp. RU20A TaxID=1907412 RepID=UPI0009541563|nr:carbon-nitrogen hydrolase family protein [Rhizobium sp. RU20A]SIQ33781.1 Predicted amidohydrolase [Rhizobium sp. RU20A]